MKRSLLLLAGAAAGAVGAYVLQRRVGTIAGAGPEPDPRAEELRRKLAEAREAAPDEQDFEAAGMAGETQVEEKPAPRINPAAAMSGGDVEEVRKRIHEEARRSTEEMNRTPPDES